MKVSGKRKEEEGGEKKKRKRKEGGACWKIGKKVTIRTRIWRAVLREEKIAGNEVE